LLEIDQKLTEMAKLREANDVVLAILIL